MPLAWSGQDVTPVYTDVTTVQRYVPPSTISAGVIANTSPSVAVSSLIYEQSRQIDAELRSIGFSVPFPDFSLSNIQTPRKIVDLCSFRVATYIRMIAETINRKAQRRNALADKADEIMQELRDTPTCLGYGTVSTPETVSVLANASNNEHGQLIPNFYRLANRNFVPSSLRFVNSGGHEVFRGEGLPFDDKRDWAVVSRAESIIVLLVAGQIAAACGGPVLAIYQFDFRDLNWGKCRSEPISGVRLSP